MKPMTRQQRSAHSPGPFVGRKRELDALTERLNSPGEGAGTLLISGEPGIGKTRLMTETAARAKDLGWKVLHGQAYDLEGLPPYLPIVEALQGYVRGCTPDELALQLGPGASEVALIVPEIRRRLGDLPAASHPDAESARYALFESVAAFIEGIGRASPSGVLLCLDDLQWADDSSLMLLEHLIRRMEGGHFLALAAYRDTELALARPLIRTLERLARQRLSSSLDVRRLSREDVGLMLGGLAGKTAPETLVAKVYDETEGIPFFVREVFEHLAERGWLFDGDGAWKTDQGIGEIDVPRSVMLVIGRRLEGLHEEVRHLLATAAVIGRSSGFDLLREISQLSDEKFIESLEQAEKTHLIAYDEQGSLSFTHELVRQTLLAELSPLRRQLLHLQAATAIEALYAGALEPHYGQLAGHYAAAGVRGNPAKVVECSVLAAKSSWAVHAWEETSYHYQRALEALDVAAADDDQLRTDILLGIGEALLALGDRRRILDEVAPAALKLAQTLGDRARAFEACRIAIDSGPSPLPEWLTVAEEWVGDDPRARIRLNQALGVQTFHEGRDEENGRLLKEALDLARRFVPDKVLQIGSGLTRAGVLAAGPEREFFEELRRNERSALGPKELADVQMDEIGFYLQWGDRARAEEVRQEMARVAARTRHRQSVLGSSVVDALFAMLDGRFADATFDQGISTFIHAWHGRLAGWLGDAAILEAELAWNKQRPPGSALGPVLEAFFLAHLGRTQEASELIRAVSPQVRATGGSAFWRAAILLEAASLSGERTAAPGLLGRFEDEQRHLAKPLAVMVPRHAGRLATLLGRHDEARACFETAIEFCERIQYRPELALTRLDLASLLSAHYPRESTAAVAQLELAIPELRAMGMRPALEQALALQQGQPPARPDEPAYPDGLSARELDVLRLIAAGRSNQQIAGDLFISVNTVARHVTHIFEKIAASNRTEAASYAHRMGLT
jgi:DNA-binding CsgD family transcriptional regulator/tetratricopeptide (TPR) repeat protein